MSTINVNNLSGKGGATPNLPDGAVISGVATVTNLKPTNVNVSGAVTATTFDGSLKSTGTPTLGLGVTINSSGLHISGVTTVGVVTGGTFYGDGSNLTGVGETIAPWNYDPGVNEEANIDTGIGITFNKKLTAGTGEITLKIVSAGVAGTTIQSWGISSITQRTTSFSASTLNNLQNDAVYQVTIPEGFYKDSGGTNYVGTAYTFDTSASIKALMAWGNGTDGQLNNSSRTNYSSPTQIPGNWSGGKIVPSNYYGYNAAFIKSDGTLWTWGRNQNGALGHNNTGDAIQYSSPVQVGSSSDWKIQQEHGFGNNAIVVKTDGTLWVWGNNDIGELGLNSRTQYSSPVQLPGTTWSKATTGRESTLAIKTNGTLWVWGQASKGSLGTNSDTHRSSPVQVPGTTWRSVSTGGAFHSTVATKTDNTLWTWGANNHGQMGVNNKTYYSSPVQIPGTTWVDAITTGYNITATKTDGTLWCWGYNASGAVGNNNTSPGYSSPIQIPGTNWETSRDYFARTTYGANGSAQAIKTDGTLWSWGYQSERGELGHNDRSARSSPKQVGSETGWAQVGELRTGYLALWTDYTP